MTSVIFLGKVCILAVFTTIFVWNMVELLQSKKTERMSADVYFEKQMWMIVSLLAIAIVLGNM